MTYDHVKWKMGKKLMRVRREVAEKGYNFYSASALLEMQTAVIATGCPSVCLSVRHFPVFVQTNENTMVQSSRF